MTTPRSRSRVYKEMTLQQLRSFCETARLGSFTAAAKSLGLAHPTVWKQVHALERQFGTKLVEAYGRGCRLTEHGRSLAELASPSITSVAALKRQFDEANARAEARLTIAATPRLVVEDLPECVVAFAKRRPNVRLSFRQLPDEEVAAVVDAGEADLGLSPVQRVALQNARLSCELAYSLDIVLVTPKNHPLARQKTVKPADLADFPLINQLTKSPQSMVSLAVERMLSAQRVPSPVALEYAAAIRRYAELGFGIGLVPSGGSRRVRSTLHERSMSHYFGRETVYLIRRRQAGEVGNAFEFAALVKSRLNR